VFSGQLSIIDELLPSGTPENARFLSSKGRKTLFRPYRKPGNELFEGPGANGQKVDLCRFHGLGSTTKNTEKPRNPEMTQKHEEIDPFRRSTYGDTWNDDGLGPKRPFRALSDPFQGPQTPQKPGKRSKKPEKTPKKLKKTEKNWKKLEKIKKNELLRD